jgi:tetratricopeptide (TPR) repeat protein
LLHRDIKPENVLAKLDANGEFLTIKLVDFGLASHESSGVQDVSGTIEYLAPELVQGGKASVATDMYALGTLLYRLATGRLPLDAQDPLALAKLRTTAEVPPPLHFRPDLPVGLSDVISAMLRLRPDDRPASARHVIALLNEREGTDFPYETAATSSAYIRSATGVTNVHARERMSALLCVLLKNETPPNLMIVGMNGLGRTRLMADFATDLMLKGVPARWVKRDADLAWGEERPRVALVSIANELSRPELAERIANSKDAWWIVAAEASDEPIATALGAVETLHLAPLGLEGVRRFIAATFPENNFPADMAAQVYTYTLGLPGAVHEQLNRLLESETLRIGLAGWELMPGVWEIPVHRHAAQFIEHQLAQLPEPAVWLARAVACTASALPRDVLGNLTLVEQRDEAWRRDAIEGLARIGWMEEQSDGYTLTFAAVARYLQEQLSAEERQELHQKLLVAWTFENMAAHPRQAREVLFQDFHAASWVVSAEDAQATLKAATEAGENAWVRSVVKAGLANHPPRDLWAVMRPALGDLEYIEANLEAAAACYADVLHRGKLAVTPRNAWQFSRYAMIEEKLGHTEHAEEMLIRCLDVLHPGHDANAGAVYGTLAWIAFRRGDAEQARQLAEEGLVRVPPKTLDTGVALLLNTVATLAFYSGDADAAVMAWKRCLEVNEAVRDRKGIANMYNNLGVAAAQSGDRLRARSLWKKCEEIAHEIHDMHRLAGIYNNLGIDSLESGLLPQAEEYYWKALTMFRRLKSPRDQVELLNNLGELSYYRADYARAQAYWQEALNLAASVDDRESQVEPLVYLGKLLSTLEDLEKAETTLTKALNLAHELAVKKGEGQAWEGLAQLHARRGERDQSAAALRNAHTVLTEEVDPLACLHLHLTECAIAAEQGNGPASQNALAQARKVADTKWDPFTAARTLVCGLLFAQEQVDQKERSRLLRQLSVYPDFLWKFHWASGRRLSAEGAIRKALEEYGRGVAVLKAIASRLSADHRERYLNAPHITRFKAEALELRKSLQGVDR